MTGRKNTMTINGNLEKKMHIKKRGKKNQEKLNGSSSSLIRVQLRKKKTALHCN